MKNAVILGATAGVGRAITETLTDSGYRTLGFHRGNHEVGGLKIHQLVKANASVADVCISDVVKFCNQVDVLVHCITGAAVGSALHTSPEDVERTFENLAHSFLWWANELAEEGLLGVGTSTRLIALSNPCPDFYLRNTGVIGAAKAALEAYVKMLAVELGPSGVRVNCVRFGMVKTPAIEKVLSPTALAAMQKTNEVITPCGRMQTTQDVAQIVKALVSDEMYWLNGAIIDATGGATSTLMDYTFYGRH